MVDEKPNDARIAAEKAYATAAEAVTIKAPADTPAKAILATPKKTAAAKPAAKKPISAKAKPAKQPAAPAKSKDTLMTTSKTKTTGKTKTTAFTATVKDTFAGAQAQAKTAYGKGAAIVAGASAFTKGNVEACVESGKILTEGLKTLGHDYAAEGKKAYETLAADAKELVAVKSPTDFFQLQTKLIRRNFDSAFAFSSKNTEATVKLVNAAFAPIAGRISLAVAAVKKAA